MTSAIFKNLGLFSVEQLDKSDESIQKIEQQDNDSETEKSFVRSGISDRKNPPSQENE